MTPLAQNRKLQLVLVVAVCLASSALLVSRLHYGFLPEDDAALATIAERTLHGELPNVDFYDNYTGGLTFLDALSLRLFGMGLISPRIMLLLFFIPWVPTLWWIARRVTDPLTASLLTLVGVVWSVPVYPIPYGSWYNLYFATFGTAALFRYLDTGHRRWIFWAGICGGLSFLVKISALYFLAAAILFLLFVEQRESVRTPGPKLRWSAYCLFLTVILLAFCAVLFKLIHTAGGASRYYHFVLPGVALCLLIIAQEWRYPRSTALARLSNIWPRAFLLAVGTILPVAIFLLPYFQRHGVTKWAQSIILSSARLHVAAHAPMPNATALICIPLLLVLWANAEWDGRRSRTTATILFSIGLIALLVFVIGRVIPSRLVWFSVAEVVPLLVAVGVLVLWEKNGGNSGSSERLMLLLSVIALCSLIQFPFTAPMYFCFIVTIVFTTIASLAQETTTPVVITPIRSLMVPVFGFYLLFGLLALLPGEFYLRQFEHHPEAAFTLPRAAGFIGEKDAVELYEKTIPEVLRHAGSAPIYAGPDSPELYFLTGHRNPTPIYLEFLAGRDSAPDRILNLVDSSGVRTVVINHGGLYVPSGPPSPELLDGLRERFPEAKVIGRFEIRWRP